MTKDTEALAAKIGEIAASIRINLYRAVPTMPNYPVGIVEAVLTTALAPSTAPDTIGSHFGNGGGLDPAAGVAPALIEWITELARRDILRTQTDFIGRMHQAIGEFESICDDNPDGEFDEAARDDAGEALAGLAGLSLAQLAMVSDPADPIKQLAHPPQPTPVDPVAGGEALREAAQSVLDMMFSTYKARNGREVGVQGDDGEKVWLVHSDQIEDLRRALATIATTPHGSALLEAIERAEHPLPWVIYSEPDVGLPPTIFSGVVGQSGFCPVDLELAGNQNLIVTALAALKGPAA
jgi:hypothetical protein